MKLTIEVNETDIITIDEIIKKLGIEKFCQKRTYNPLCFSFKDQDGEGFFDVETGEVEYAGEQAEVYNYYQEELGCNSLMEALDFSSLVWGENEDGETVAYYEA